MAHIRRALAVVIALLAAATGVAAQAPSQKVTVAHAIAMHGDVKYGPDFKHFAYADPKAVKGGEVRNEAIGQTFVARSDPDGYTLLLAGGSMAGARYVNAQMGYDLLSDFTPISSICWITSPA